MNLYLKYNQEENIRHFKPLGGKQQNTFSSSDLHRRTCAIFSLQCSILGTGNQDNPKKPSLRTKIRARFHHIHNFSYQMLNKSVSEIQSTANTSGHLKLGEYQQNIFFNFKFGFAGHQQLLSASVPLDSFHEPPEWTRRGVLDLSWPPHPWPS